MSVTLTARDGGGFYLDGYKWPCALRLAISFGWRPVDMAARGASVEGIVDGKGEITCDDAKRLADALERALPDVPTFEVEAELPNALEEFAGLDGRELLQRLITFCRVDGFALTHERCGDEGQGAGGAADHAHRPR